MKTIPTDTWKHEVLDFLAWRANAMFSEWTPRSMPALARLLSGRDWETIVVANILASPSFHRDVHELVRLAPREMEQDRRQSVARTRGRIRGRILAGRTINERIRRADNTIWVTTRTDKIWHTEPNRHVAGFLSYLMRASATVLDHTSQASQSPVSIGVEAVDRALRSEPLRRIEPDPQWASNLIPSALTAKSRFYRIADMWSRGLRDARRTRDAESLRAVLLDGWLSAEDDDRLLEVYALSRVISSLYDMAKWDQFSLAGGVRASGATEVSATADDISVTVRFDRTPPIAGQYAWLLKRYANIDGKARRPDLQIDTRSGAQQLVTLLEVKATSPNSQYGRDSIVKVFGYLKDFSSLWADEVECRYPRAMLLYANNVVPQADLAVRVKEDEVLLTDTTSFDPDIRAVLARHRELLGP